MNSLLYLYPITIYLHPVVRVVPFTLKTQWLFFSLKNNTCVKPLSPLPSKHTYIFSPLSCCPSTSRSSSLALAAHLPAVLFISTLTSSPSSPSRPVQSSPPWALPQPFHLQFQHWATPCLPAQNIRSTTHLILSSLSSFSLSWLTLDNILYLFVCLIFSVPIGM